jgi:hypothetical protein
MRTFYIANIGALIFGINLGKFYCKLMFFFWRYIKIKYFLGWSAPASETVINDYGWYFSVSPAQFGFVVGATALGGAIASTFAGILRKLIGTRYVICFFGLPIILGYVLITIPLNISMVKKNYNFLSVDSSATIFFF